MQSPEVDTSVINNEVTFTNPNAVGSSKLTKGMVLGARAAGYLRVGVSSLESVPVVLLWGDGGRKQRDVVDVQDRD
jgi:hypothetical protein